ncbi:hypothetical protein [Paenibacillus mendelii]|uniref:Uncharacterized protein n=1 Tax=Paenibacillus mendelii TaxID=206163 RepID=A0ABV6JG03_9BACL|nr:hypothetical protein [Paenibacillus mendelii]MCQ6561505.1 hypothetical protein [Paenibacillus mendelii]
MLIASGKGFALGRQEMAVMLTNALRYATPGGTYAPADLSSPILGMVN